MKIYLLAPNYCWHTSDLLELCSYNKDLKYIFIADTPPFISRVLFNRFFSFLNIPYEFFQRLWRLFLFIPWSFYLRKRLINNNPIHCHGLFSLIIAKFANIDSKRIVFTPQGSDILVLPENNRIIKNFLKKNLSDLRFITADSSLILKKCINICPSLKKENLMLIQNGIPLKKINNLVKRKSSKYKREIDICWIRGLGKIYQFEYFLELIKMLSKLTPRKINIAIISAYGSKFIPKEIFEYKNININLLPRLNSDEFLKCIFNSKIAVSIPSSDSSPRSVYESVFLGCKLFLTKLDCLNWLPKDLQSKFLYSSGNLTRDVEILINEITNFEEDEDLKNYFIKYREFSNNLKYSYIAKSYFEIFQKVI